MNPRDDLVVGVDAGGTKTTAWLATVHSDQLAGRGEAGPGNPRAAGMSAATAEIAAAISRAFADASLPSTSLAGLCLGVAGAGRKEEQEELAAWAATHRTADKIVVTHDAEPILAAASPNSVGIALISGTGSLAWGRSAAGNEDRAGGWGYLFGDEGSGYSIALAGLRAAARGADGRGETTQLLDDFLRRFDISEASSLIESVYGAALSRRQIASLADIVFTAAPGDRVAAQIVEEAGEQLAVMVTTLADRLQLSAGETTLGLAGGVLTNQPDFRADVISKTQISPERVVTVSHPAAGALLIAQRAARR